MGQFKVSPGDKNSTKNGFICWHGQDADREWDSKENSDRQC